VSVEHAVGGEVGARRERAQPPRAPWVARYRWLPPTALALVLLLLWEGAVAASGISTLVLPRPSQILTVMVVKAPDFLRHGWVTGVEVVVGFLLAAVLGSLFGVAIALAPLLGSALYPLLVSAQVMPKVAIAPLLVIWLGFGLPSKFAMTALIAFFPIVINTIIGLNMTRREGIYLFRSLGATPLQTFLKLRLPNALPVFFGGLKVASTLAVIGAVVGEFTGAKSGLGYLLVLMVGTLDTAGAFACVLYLTAIGLLLFFAVTLVERLVVPAHMLKRFDEVGSQL
jgi:NitT/TauT family transport system permease protein